MQPVPGHQAWVFLDQPRIIKIITYMASNRTLTGRVVIGPHHDLAEVEFIFNGEKRRTPINTPSGYGPQHALKGKHVIFTLTPVPYFVSETGFANIKEVLTCAPNMF